MAEILNGSERQFRARLEKLPTGIFKAADSVDDDGITQDPIRIELALSFSGGVAIADFTGSSAQVRGPLNATLEMTLSSVAYTLMAAVGQGIAKNDGCRRAIEVRAPQGSVLNACSPAPVASRITVCHRVVDVMLQALAQVIPDKVMAGYYGGSNICNLGGYDPKTRKPWVHFEIEVGGWGARPTADGLDGFSAHIHNLANTPAEIVESTSPLRVERYEFIPGSGGDGQYRGGLGLRRDLRALAGGTSLNLLGDRCKFAPAGLFGGRNGSTGAYVLNPDTERERVLPNKLSNYPLNAGDVISMRTAGGGGYGEPAKRDPEQIDRDSREGKCPPKEK
jgi:N-methylhydantoinase B